MTQEFLSANAESVIFLGQPNKTDIGIWILRPKAQWRSLWERFKSAISIRRDHGCYGNR